MSDGEVDADGEGIAEVSRSSGDPAAGREDKWVVKYDILGNPVQMVGIPTHFFKVRHADKPVYPCVSRSRSVKML